MSGIPKSRWIYITEAEATALVEATGPYGETVDLRFGSRLALLDSEDSVWAVELLRRMRAEGTT